MANTDTIYRLLTEHDAARFPPMQKLKKINPITSEPDRRAEPEIKYDSLQLDPQDTIGDIVAKIGPGSRNITLSYQQGGIPIKDEYWDEDAEDYVYGQVGVTEERITISWQTPNPNYHASKRAAEEFNTRKRQAAETNKIAREHNKQAMDYNRRLVQNAQSMHSEYWRAACKAVSKNDYSALTELVKQELLRKLERLNETNL